MRSGNFAKFLAFQSCSYKYYLVSRQVVRPQVFYLAIDIYMQGCAIRSFSLFVQ